MNLFFSRDIEGAIKDNDFISVCVNTPTKTFGIKEGLEADLQYREKIARQIKEEKCQILLMQNSWRQLF